MVWIRATAASLLLFAAATSIPANGAASTSRAPLAPSLSGVVKDDVGKLLEGVEILVLPFPEHGGDALISAVSDAGGRFLIGTMAPGVYRVAAVKNGYVAAIGLVNTHLKSWFDLVMRPAPRGGEPGTDQVLPDLSWTLRVPPRSILRDLEAGDVSRSRETGGARAFAAAVQDWVRGEVEQAFAVGSWRAGSSGSASAVAGNETRMRLAGSLGERGAIQVRGRRGSADASSSSGPNVLNRGGSDLDLDLSYDTGPDERLAMRAFYSADALDRNDLPGAAGSRGRQSHRSYGYDATWGRQVDAASRVALRVGFQDSNLATGPAGASGQDDVRQDGWNRAIGAEGSYENQVGGGHLVRFGVRAQRQDLGAPAARAGRGPDGVVLTGGQGWSVLVDTEDRWAAVGPFAVSYGLAYRQAADVADASALSTRVGASWTAGRSEAALGLSYLAVLGTSESRAPAAAGHRSPYGYDLGWTVRLDPTVTFRAAASYEPSRADRWDERGIPGGSESVYVGDGLASDRFVSVEIERAAPSASVALRVAQGRAEGLLAPALDDAPVLLLSDRRLRYGTARIRVTAPRAGSTMSLEYRSAWDDSGSPEREAEGASRTVDLEFTQDLHRFAGGRASCRLLLNARSILGPLADASANDFAGTPRPVAEDKRFGAGVSVAF